MQKSDIHGLLHDIVGQRCERATNPHGSILSIDFGALGRRPDDDLSATLHGWRHLSILSPWRIQDQQHILADWNTNGGRSGTISAAIEPLVGQRVLAAQTSSPGWDLTIQWSGGLSLVVFGDSNDDREDAWFILGTDGVEASAIPIIRTS